ncbi:MAG: GNAT family N-acetyltransferase [Candidatus Thorarchaeota archaeon]|nr:GNAT family N-acetyltransferase [Candidatus Thorarchaeota archaeon]
MTDSVTLEPLNETDLEAVVELEKQCFPDPWESDLFRLFADLGGMIQGPGGTILRFYVAHLRQEVVGYVCWEDSRRNREARVSNIAVAPRYRRLGIGTLLMRFVMASAQRAGCARLSLEVREKNLPARRLYEKMGLHPTGRSPKYYGDEDAIIYSTSLTSSPL